MVPRAGIEPARPLRGPGFLGRAACLPQISQFAVVLFQASGIKRLSVQPCAKISEVSLYVLVASWGRIGKK
jgi:hypothetical protein